jgi:hypothetical protein
MMKIQLEGRTLEAMADEITEIGDRLVAIECQRHDAAAITAVRSIVQRDALLTFKKRVPERLKLVVEAARPDTIEDALAVASAALAGVDQKEAKVFWGDYVPTTNSAKTGQKQKCQVFWLWSGGTLSERVYCVCLPLQIQTHSIACNTKPAIR